MKTNLKPSDFEFEVPLPFQHAAQLEEALDHALKAMAHYGTGEDEMLVISALLVTALRHMNAALNKHEAERAA